MIHRTVNMYSVRFRLLYSEPGHVLSMSQGVDVALSPSLPALNPAGAWLPYILPLLSPFPPPRPSRTV